MPPFDMGECAYILFVPLLIWLKMKPTYRAVIWVGLGSSFLSWISILVFLRHVTYIGTFLLAFFLSLYFIIWLCYTRWLLPKISQKHFVFRFLGFTAIAGLWVILEWLRSFLLYGMPMGPLALSQWQRPVLLQIGAWTGAYGISFFLIFFNCCLAQTLYRLVAYRREKVTHRWFSPDFYMGIFSLMALPMIYFQSLPGSFEKEETIFNFALVQPNVEPLIEWNAVDIAERFAVLEAQVERIALMDFDLLLLPEGVTPNAILGDYTTLQATEAMVNRTGRPFLMGSQASDAYAGYLHNGVFLVEPELGLNPNYYAKQKLVPFGEFVPYPFHGLVERFAAIQGAFSPGSTPSLFNIKLNNKPIKLGALICYEDCFPQLARKSVSAGADILFVATNDAWYGEEGAAYYHAAHSVLRAVENRRPVIRSGNAGWSGWIDPYGKIRDLLVNDANSIYFRGGGVMELKSYPEFKAKMSFYTKHGDWFVFLSGVWVTLGFGAHWLSKTELSKTEESIC